eukprot:7714794-Pyramimonas_sp.AAC.1
MCSRRAPRGQPRCPQAGRARNRLHCTYGWQSPGDFHCGAIARPTRLALTLFAALSRVRPLRRDPPTGEGERLRARGKGAPIGLWSPVDACQSPPEEGPGNARGSSTILKLLLQDAALPVEVQDTRRIGRYSGPRS